MREWESGSEESERGERTREEEKRGECKLSQISASSLKSVHPVPPPSSKVPDRAGDDKGGSAVTSCRDKLPRPLLFCLLLLRFHGALALLYLAYSVRRPKSAQTACSFACSFACLSLRVHGADRAVRLLSPPPACPAP